MSLLQAQQRWFSKNLCSIVKEYKNILKYIWNEKKEQTHCSRTPSY